MKYLSLAGLVLSAPLAYAAMNPIVDAEDRRQAEAPIVLSAAHSKDATERERAAVAWGRMHSAKSIDYLLELLHDKSSAVQVAAAFALGQLGWQAEFSDGRETEIQFELSALLSDKSLPLVRTAVEALGKIGLTKTPELVTPVLHSQEAEVRANAVLALYRYRLVLHLRDVDKDLKQVPTPVFNILLKLAEDRDARVRRSVAYFFARVAEPRGETVAAKLVHDKDVWTRVYALMGLQKMKAQKSKEDLVYALNDSEYSVRLAALSALTSLAEPLGTHGFLAQDKSQFVRAAFAQGLDSKIKDEAAMLHQLLTTDKSPTVRAEALKSLAKTEPSAIEQAMADPNWLMREAAVQSSAALGDKREAFLAHALGDADRNVQGAALEAIGLLPTPSAYALILKNMDSDQLILRGTAVAALKERKEKEIPELAWKTYSHSLDRRWIEMRQDLVEILNKTLSEKTTGYLKTIVPSDPEPSVSGKARRALQSRGVTDLAPSQDVNLTFSPFRELTFQKNPLVEFKTNKGTFVVETYPKSAPIHVADFIGNVRNGFYNGLLWHRVVANFVVQGGDPDGTGWGDAGYSLRSEINSIGYARGSLGMPRSQGFDTGGSQLFFTHLPTLHLDGQYTVFGRIIKGIAVLDQLERGDKILSARELK